MKKDLQNLELLSANLDDELTQSEKAEVEKLLASSLELQKKLEDLNVNLENIVKEKTEELSAANKEMQKINFNLNVARDAL